MSEIFNKSLTASTHGHDVIDTDAVFKVDAVTRAITTDKKEIKVIKQGDHNAEKFTFEIPRYIEGHDMYLCNSVQVHFLNIETNKKGENKFVTGVYTVNDFQLKNEETLTCSWLLSKNATVYAGNLSFMISLSCLTDINVDYRWITGTYSDIYITDSLNANLSFEEQYVDVIEQWKASVKKELYSYIEFIVSNGISTSMQDLSNEVNNQLGKITENLNADLLEYESDVNKAIDTHKEEVSSSVDEIRTYTQNNINTFDDILKKELKDQDDEINVLKSRMDGFTNLPEGSTTGDAELADIRVGANGITYDNAGTAVREQINENKNYVNNIIEGIIDPCGIQVLEFDRLDQGSSIDIYTGVTAESTDEYYVIDYLMPVDRNKSHYMSYDKDTRTYLYFYSQSGDYLSYIYVEKSGLLEEFPENTKYIKIVFIRNSEEDNVALRTIKILEGSDKPYSNLILSEGIVKSNNCDFFIRNLLKLDDLEYGMVFNPSYGNVYDAGDLERTVTGFIDISNIYNITTNFMFYIAYYDVNKAFITELADGMKHESGTLSIPEHDQLKYARLLLITMDSSIISNYYISNCSYPYTKDGMIMPECLPDEISEIPTKVDNIEKKINYSWYNGKKITVFGDSITEGNKWQPYIADLFGCNMINCGIGGTTVANNGDIRTHNGVEIESWMCSDDRINLIPNDSDMIILFGGANDWSQSIIPMGELGDGNLIDTTFKSAYSLMIKKIVNKFPNARLIAMTLINGRTSAVDVNEDNQLAIRGLTLYDFSVAVKEICMYYGIPCIDIHGESGISTFNHTTYIGDIVHPNDEGGKKIANAVINGLKRFEPIDL